MRSSNVLEDEGVILAQRLITMKLTDFTADDIVAEIIDNKEFAVNALMYLVSLASKNVTLEVWQKVLLEEQNGI